MTKQAKQRSSPEYEEQSVTRSLEILVRHLSLLPRSSASHLRNLKAWRLELESSGSAAAIATLKAATTKLTQLRRDNKRLNEEEEIEVLFAVTVLAPRLRLSNTAIAGQLDISRRIVKRGLKAPVYGPRP